MGSDYQQKREPEFQFSKPHDRALIELQDQRRFKD
jgi:hypothetical protein